MVKGYVRVKSKSDVALHGKLGFLVERRKILKLVILAARDVRDGCVILTTR